MGDCCSHSFPEDDRRREEYESYESHKAKNEEIEHLRREVRRLQEGVEAISDRVHNRNQVVEITNNLLDGKTHDGKGPK